MDAFLAPVEQLDDAAPRGPADQDGASRRRVVAAASYEARRYDARSAMPMLAPRRPSLSLVSEGRWPGQRPLVARRAGRAPPCHPWPTGHFEGTNRRDARRTSSPAPPVALR
ncbi:hypothetical protein [Sorangium sp. So ce1335]|uniref:Y-family DNA polymerase n=1 Tax=Sorangium sp. So ce1335 TaxID=3133335 RepID=UPI003F637679